MSYNEPPPPNQPPTYGGGSGYGDQPPVYGSGQPAYGGQPAAGTSKKAIWSLVVGILSLLCCSVITGPIAIVLSRSAKSDIATTGQEGSGLATAGLVLGIIGLVLGVIQIILIATGVIDLNFSTSTSSS